MKNLKEEISYPEQGILSKVITKENGINVTLFCMSKGTDMTEHTSTKEATVYVIEGDGTFMLEGKAIPMTEGVFIRMEKDARHSLKANENTTFILTLLERD